MVLTITIDSHREVQDSRENYVAYRVVATIDDWQNILEKRYSEFLELHRVMKMFRRLLHEELPRFPGQKIWRRLVGNFGEADIEERKAKLEAYLSELVNTLCARNSTYFAEFLGMPNDVRDAWLRE